MGLQVSSLVAGTKHTCILSVHAMRGGMIRQSLSLAANRPWLIRTQLSALLSSRLHFACNRQVKRYDALFAMCSFIFASQSQGTSPLRGHDS